MAAMFLQLVKTEENKIKTFNHEKGTIYYCTDTGNVYIDREPGSRVTIKKITVICQTQNEFDLLKPYSPSKLYIILGSNLFHITDEFGQNAQVTTYDQIVGTILSDPSMLVPKLLTQDGIPMAPVTSSVSIIDENGNYITSEIEQMRYLVNHMNKTHMYKTKPSVDDQKTFTVHYPRHDYDVTSDPIFVLKDDVFVNRSEYNITDDGKIVFNTGIKLNEELTFLFNYHIVRALNELAMGSVSINSLDEEVKTLIKSSVDPSKIIFGDGQTLSFKIQELQEVADFINGNSGGGGTTSSLSETLTRIEDVLGQFHGEYLVDDTENKASLSDLGVTMNTILSKVEAIENKVNNDLQVSSIKGVQRGTATIPMNNETVEIAFATPIDPNKTLITLNGDSYYNETPYVWEVRSDRFFVRQKITVANDNYVSTFSWQAVEYL